MEITIHVGVHKTGTTALQNFFFPGLDQAEYFDRIRIEKFKNYILLEDDFSFSPTQSLKLFEDQISSSTEQRIIISDEDFYCSPYFGGIDKKRIIDRLLSTFKPYKVRIIIFIRNQSELLSSLFLQYIKTGGTANAAQFMRSKKLPLIVNENYFLFSGYVKYCQESIGKEGVKVILYEDFKSRPSKTLIEIEEFIGAKNKGKVNMGSKKSNASISPKLVWLMIFFNRLSKSSKNPHQLIGFQFYRLYSRFVIMISSFLSQSKSVRFLEFDENQIQKIGRSNKELLSLLPQLELVEHKYYIKG
jgi:hypothetical protein